MNKITKSLLVLVPALIIHGFVSPVEDFLSVPGPLSFEGRDFELAWSSHPNAGFYKQEYVPSGQSPESFDEMMIIDVLVSDIQLSEALNSKVKELSSRKSSDPYVNYDVIENPNTGEYILDFLVSNSNGGAADVVEWNAYRYVKLRDKSDKDGVLLIAISRRGYRDGIDDFLGRLKTERPESIKALSSFDVPSVSIRD